MKATWIPIASLFICLAMVVRPGGVATAVAADEDVTAKFTMPLDLPCWWGSGLLESIVAEGRDTSVTKLTWSEDKVIADAHSTVSLASGDLDVLVTRTVYDRRTGRTLESMYLPLNLQSEAARAWLVDQDCEPYVEKFHYDVEGQRLLFETRQGLNLDGDDFINERTLTYDEDGKPLTEQRTIKYPDPDEPDTIIDSYEEDTLVWKWEKAGDVWKGEAFYKSDLSARKPIEEVDGDILKDTPKGPFPVKWMECDATGKVKRLKMLAQICDNPPAGASWKLELREYGQLKESSWLDKDGNAIHKLEYDYDARGRLTAIVSSRGERRIFGYEEDGRVRSDVVLSLAGEGGQEEIHLTRTYTYADTTDETK